MADEIRAVFHTKRFTGALRDLEKRVDRATMWALREVGREVRKEARKRAPVYRGDDQRAVPGELKKSIAPSRRLKRVGPHAYSLVIGPRGARVHTYAPAAEGRTAFMRHAYEAVMPRVGEIHARAWRKAIERR